MGSNLCSTAARVSYPNQSTLQKMDSTSFPTMMSLGRTWKSCFSSPFLLFVFFKSQKLSVGRVQLAWALIATSSSKRKYSLYYAFWKWNRNTLIRPEPKNLSLFCLLDSLDKQVQWTSALFNNRCHNRGRKDVRSSFIKLSRTLKRNHLKHCPRPTIICFRRMLRIVHQARVTRTCTMSLSLVEHWSLPTFIEFHHVCWGFNHAA